MFFPHQKRFVLSSALCLVSVVSCMPPPDFSNHIPPYGQPYNYSQRSIEYFKEISFGSEFGNAKQIVHKWAVPHISISLHGKTTNQDKATLKKVTDDLSPLTGIQFQLLQGDSNANINIYIVHPGNFKKYKSDYNENNPQDAIFFPTVAGNGIISNCLILIDHLTTAKNTSHRNHLIREEFTQCLGLFKDSYRYTNSIFQQDPKYMPNQFSFIDKEVIRLLYDPKTTHGMNVAQFSSAYSSRQIASNP